jgi:hypothetical protein
MRKSGDDFFDDTVCKIFLLRVAAHILEGEDSNRRLVRKWQTWACDGCCPAQPHTIDPHRPYNVLELLLPCVLERDLKLTVGVLLHPAGDTDPSGFSKPLQPSSHVHAITEDVSPVDDDVPHVDAHAELYPPFLWHVGIALGHAPLDINSAAHRIHHAAELSQQSIPGVLDNSATAFSDFGIDERAQVILELGVCPLFVKAGQPAVSGHIDRQDGD